MESLCRACANFREVISGTGSTFLLCELSQSDKRFQKYPPQPIVRCDGYQAKRKALTLEILPDLFAICRLSNGDPIPHWAQGDFTSITRSSEELSIVCPQANVPKAFQCEQGWKCLRVAGQLDLSLVGVISSLTDVLTSANISVFVISTFDTDYLLVKEGDFEASLKALNPLAEVV